MEGINSFIHRLKLARILTEIKLDHKKYSSYFKEIIKTDNFSLADLISLLKKYNISKTTQEEVLKFGINVKEIFIDKIHTNETMYKLSAELLEYLVKRFPIWQDRVYTEIGDMIIVKPYLDGNLNYVKLLKGVEYCIESTTWDNMQEIEKMDLHDFRTCYFHQAWTPAGIMCMRVIESAMRHYYTKITKGKKKTNWAKILDDLRKNYATISNKKLLDILEVIREHIRNPIVHPDQSLTSEDTELAFQQTIQVLKIVYG